VCERVGDTFLQYPRGLLGQLCAAGRELPGVADSARCIRDRCADALAAYKDEALLLDWWRMCSRFTEEASQACRGRAAGACLLRRLQSTLRRDDVAGKHS
jgi:hypothetical protein